MLGAGVRLKLDAPQHLGDYQTRPIPLVGDDLRYRLVCDGIAVEQRLGDPPGPETARGTPNGAG